MSSAGRLFVSRLDEARSPITEKVHEIGRRPRARTEEIHDLAEYINTMGCVDAKGDNVDSIAATSSCQNKRDYGDNSQILEKLSEYLFDLFDANMMEDYAKMEKFEIRALEHFTNVDDTEFTHEQHALHNEFVALFEQLIEGFLAAEGYSIDDFYTELVHFIEKEKKRKKTDKTAVAPADEVLRVVSCYMQFDVWAGLMHQQARKNADFSTMVEKIQQASGCAVDLFGRKTSAEAEPKSQASSKQQQGEKGAK